MKKLRVGIIGSGIAGLTCAYFLDREHSVTLFEKNDYVGGHTHTVMVDHGHGRQVAVDTGFSLINRQTYPNFIRFLEILDVPLCAGDCSFAYWDPATDMSYNSNGFLSYFDRFSTLLDIRHYRVLKEIRRFNREAGRDYYGGKLGALSLEEYLSLNSYSEAFIQHYVLPLCSAILSSPAQNPLSLTAEAFVRFFVNYGLMKGVDKQRCSTVEGGSHSYVKKILAGLSGQVLTSTGVRSIKRRKRDVELIAGDGRKYSFDRIIIATHADQALNLLDDPDENEERLLSVWKYKETRAILHSDTQVLPKNRRLWSSWNIVHEAGDGKGLSFTSHMNRIQGLDKGRDYFLTLNTGKHLDPYLVKMDLCYYHPVLSSESAASRIELSSLNGVRNTWYCGSYFGSGFHEDAVNAALSVIKDLGSGL